MSFVVQLVLPRRLDPRAGLHGSFRASACPELHPALSFRLAARTPAPAAISVHSVVHLVLLDRLRPSADLTGPLWHGLCPNRHPALSSGLALWIPIPGATRDHFFSSLWPVPLTLLAPDVVSFAPWLDAVCLG